MKASKILWLGFALPDQMVQSIFAIDPLPAIQTHKFGWSFVRALQSAFSDVILASSIPVQNFPIVPRLYFFGQKFYVRGLHGIALGFINVILLKHLTRLLSCFLILPLFMRRRKIDWLFVHGVHSPYLIFGVFARLIGYRVVVVLTDAPGVILPSDRMLSRLLKRFDKFLVELALSFVDAVIALAPGLSEALAPKKPALIFPGIMDSSLNFLPRVHANSSHPKTDDSHPFTVVYAGGLNAAYGVDRLVEAILGFESSFPIRLKLYGRGDQEDRIRHLAHTDSRFFYGGFLDSVSIWPELCGADLLVNPRPTTELFASLSFPSKLIEYLSAGRPVLTTRIPSMPDILKPYYFFIDNESPQGIRDELMRVMRLPVGDRLYFANKAKYFADSHYSEEAIGIKVADFIEKLF